MKTLSDFGCNPLTARAVDFAANPTSLQDAHFSGVPNFGNLFSNTDFPGVLFIKVKSIYELIGRCSGFYFEWVDPGNGNHFGKIVVGTEAARLLNGADLRFYQYPGQTTGIFVNTSGPDLSSLARAADDSLFPFVDKRSQNCVWAADMQYTSGVAPTLVNVVGLIADADWGWGCNEVSGLSTGNVLGFSMVKHLPLTTVGQILRDMGQDLFVKSADSKVQQYMGQALNEWMLDERCNTMITVPLARTKWNTGPLDGSTWDSNVTSVWRDDHGIPSYAPVGNTANNSLIRAWFPTKDSTPLHVITPMRHVADDAGKHVVADVLSGFCLLDSVRPDGSGPGRASFAVAGESLSVAVKQAIEPWLSAATSLVANGADNMGEVKNSQNVTTAFNGFAGVSGMNAKLSKLMDGPVGYGGFTTLMAASQEICARAEHLARAALK